jgi:hypothetical protein
MRGTSKDITQAGLALMPLGADGMAAVFQGSTQFMAGIGDMAFRLYGESGPEAVPEPSSLAILGVGAVGLAACAWRRRRRIA